MHYRHDNQRFRLGKVIVKKEELKYNLVFFTVMVLVLSYGISTTSFVFMFGKLITRDMCDTLT